MRRRIFRGGCSRNGRFRQTGSNWGVGWPLRQEVYERFIKYLKGCADLIRQGYTDVCQFTCEKG